VHREAAIIVAWPSVFPPARRDKGNFALQLMRNFELLSATTYRPGAPAARCYRAIVKPDFDEGRPPQSKPSQEATMNRARNASA
jgi:hypothetical protein